MGKENRRIRGRNVLLGAVVVFLAAPVPRVFTATTPIVRTIKVVGNNMREVKGVAAPNLALTVQFRQRSFVEDENNFKFCSWFNDGNWLSLGTAVANSKGNWTVDGTDYFPPNGVTVRPPVVAEQECDGALYTEFQILSDAGVTDDADAPQLSMLNVSSSDASKDKGNARWVETTVSNADTIAACVSDGPDMPGTEHPGSDDIDEDGVDVCKVFGCGAQVSFMRLGGTLVAPSIIEDFETGGFPPVMDPEFDFITGMVQAHAPSRSFIAIATLPRIKEPETAFNLNVNINGIPNISCGGNPLFAFFKAS